MSEARHQIAENRSRPLPAVVAILKLLHVLLKVLLRNVNVRPADRQLQSRPKSLDPVNMTVAINIFPCAMIHRLMLETGLGKTAVGFQFVGINRASCYDVLFNDRLKSLLSG